MEDVVEFLEAFGEMCDSFSDCNGCPMQEHGMPCNPDNFSGNADIINEIVSIWTRKNKN